MINDHAISRPRFFPVETRRVVVHVLHCLRPINEVVAEHILPLAVPVARVLPYSMDEWA